MVIGLFPPDDRHANIRNIIVVVYRLLCDFASPQDSKQRCPHNSMYVDSHCSWLFPSPK